MKSLEDVRKVLQAGQRQSLLGVYKGLTVLIQQTCPGCYVYLRGALDSFKNTGIDVEKMVAEEGECVFIAGGVPDFDPLCAPKAKICLCLGDCWKYFPSKEKVEEAMKLAKKVFTYPGCAPVYVFSKVNTDLQAFAQGKA
ncbi:MAG: hypothetical protein ABC360_05065 [Acetomicrobium sp.]